MSRPIPEGVELPKPNAVILGWGKGFKVPEEGFQGYAIWPGKYPDWNEGHKQGDDDRLIYAASADSEVARLNQKEALLGKFVRTHNEGTAPSVAVEDLKEPDKDALIRDLVESLQQWEDAMCAAICHPGVRIELVSEVAHASRKGFEVLTLARTICPELF